MRTPQPVRMPSKPTPRIASIRRWVALSTVIVFLSVWLAVLTLGKGGLATGTSTTASTSSSGDTSSDASSIDDDDSGSDDDDDDDDEGDDDSSQGEAPSMDTSQS